MRHGLRARLARRLVVAVSIAVVAVIVSACGHDPTSPDFCSESTGVSVSPGLEPTFSWSGGCRVSDVLVEELPPPSFRSMWYVDTPTMTENVLGSPIQYGRAPAGGTVVTAPVPLVAGRQYKVSLRSLGRGFQSVVLTATFVP